MMIKQRKIQVLPEEIINQIAAGEVIENPSSVVKELVENAIDANAKNIHIEINGGGLQLIRIEDDGIGMDKEDLLLCIRPHATSKIQSFEEIQNIISMGFRGEALASIASIAKMKIDSSDGNEANLLSIEKGKVISLKPSTRNKGTTIEIRSLFYNVPARKKFQSSISSNISKIHKIIINLALANPNINFSFISQGKSFLLTKSYKDDLMPSIEERIKELFGKGFFECLTPIEHKEGKYHFYGYIGFPKFAKKTRNNQHLFINNRVVTNPIISKLIKEGYGTRLDEKSHPIFILHMKLPTELVDVNVHPQKLEIRLRELDFLQEILKKAVSLSLQKALPLNFNILPSFQSNEITKQKVFYSEKFKSEEKPFLQESLFDQMNKFSFAEYDMIGRYLLVDSKSISTRIFLEQETEAKGMIIIDLLSAYARCLFNRFSILWKKNAESHDGQFLSLPIKIDISPEEMHFIEKHEKEFRKAGITLRILGEKLIAVDSIPMIVNQNEFKDLFFQILDDYSLYDKTNAINLTKMKNISKKFCKIAKARKTFSLEEAKNIFSELVDCEDPYRDPMGNPTMIFCSSETIGKLFKTQGK